jgi:cupin fold WbuC family metalloprotein
MKKIFSRQEPEILLHLVNRMEEINDRTDICPQEEFLQLASLKMEKGKTFRPHKHIFKQGEEKVISQESWVVIAGKVKAMFYDLDNKLIESLILHPGDCSVTFRGGHNYEILEDKTIVYEFKTGPYKGQRLDKEFI